MKLTGSIGTKLLAWVFAAFALQAGAGELAIAVDRAQGQVDLADASYLLEDASGRLTVEDLQRPEKAAEFEIRPFQLGFSTSVFWVRYTFRNREAEDVTWWLDTGSHTMHEVSLFVPDRKGDFQVQHTGVSRPFAQRPLPLPNFVFPVTVPASGEMTVYLRLKSYGFMPMRTATIHPLLSPPAAYQQRALDARTEWFFYLGMAAALCMFNLVLFFSIRDVNYLLYVGSLLSMAWAVSCGGGGNGWSYQAFWPQSPVFEQVTWVLSTPIAAWCMSLFVWHFLNVRNAAPKLYKITFILVFATTSLFFGRAVVTALQAPGLSTWMEIAFKLGTTMQIFVLALIFSSVGVIAWRGSRAARILLVAWAPLFVGIAIASVSVVKGYGPQPSVIMWASALELVLMSLALADRYNQERNAKTLAQTALVNNLQQSERELEVKVQQRTQELHAEKLRSQALLHNMLPAEIAGELSSTGTTTPVRHESVTVLFTDFSGFTQAAATMPAGRMVAELNEVFAAFDDICDEEGVEKIKTIGDAYMAAAGLPKPCAEHAQRCVRAGLRMAAFMEQRNADAAFKWRLRVGIHSGPVVAGVVGKRKYAFDIWGDTVNIASRMESSGEPGRVNVSAYTFDLIRTDFACEYRGKLSAKGKGEVDMYFVNNPLESTA